VTPEINHEPLYGNEFAYFEFHDPQGGQIIRHRFHAKVWQLRWNMSPADFTAVTSWPEDFSVYLRPHSILANDADFLAKLNQIVPWPSGNAADLVSVMNWIDQNLTYDHANASLRADAQFAFNQLRGHCSDYHGLCATMGRSLGHPTRVTYGLHLLPKSSPSHCKMEAFLPPHGWVSFDLSETQRMVKQIQNDEQLSPSAKDKLASAARQRMLSGFRDNTWLLVTRGTDYKLVPPASETVPVVRTIYAEADGVTLPDPDPSNPKKREFSWMTVHQFKPDRPVRYPFTDLKSLESSLLNK
jgi:transglutaminase-like putative cysteine protease